jgi:hypothetical protein
MPHWGFIKGAEDIGILPQINEWLSPGLEDGHRGWCCDGQDDEDGSGDERGKLYGCGLL